MSDKLSNWAKDTKNKKYVFLLIGAIVIGVALTFMPSKESNMNSVQTVVKNVTASEDLSYEETLEKKLTNILQKMEGVGEVSVMLTTVSNEEKVLAEDTVENTQHSEQKDQAGGTSTTQNTQTTNKVVLQSGNTPYVIKAYAPEIKGVFILAEGAADSMVKGQITEAVSKLLDVPVHKISVEKKQK